MPRSLRRFVFAGEMLVPHVEVGLGHAGVGGEHEQHRVRVRQQVQRQLGLGADRVQSRRVEDDSPCCSSGCGKLMIACRQHGNVDAALVAALERRQDVVVALGEQPVLARERDRNALDLRDARERFRHPVRRGEIERERHPLVRVVLEFGDRRFVEPRLDRQQPDRRRPRRIVQKLGRAHRRAAGRRRQQPLAEIGEEDRVDQLRLAARELRDECDDELVLLQPLQQLLDLDVGLRVGEVLLLQPFVQRRNARRQPATPIGVGFEARGEFA